MEDFIGNAADRHFSSNNSFLATEIFDVQALKAMRSISNTDLPQEKGAPTKKEKIASSRKLAKKRTLTQSKKPCETTEKEDTRD